MSAKPKRKEDILSLIHAPARVASVTTELIEKMQADRGGGILFGFDEVDNDLNPARPGDLIIVAGYTSNWKSSMMNWIAFEELKRIMGRGDTNQIVIKATWEQSVEEDTLAWLATESQIPVTKMVRGELDDAEWVTIRRAAIGRQVAPLWLIGHSLMESIQNRRARPRMTMTDVAVALDMIINQATGMRREPRMIVMDYLQRIRPDPDDGPNMRERIIEIVNRAKDAAVAFGCPVFLGVQAGRTVNDHKEQIPEMNDLLESSTIEQTADKILALWYPIKYRKFGSLLDNAVVSPKLLVMRLLKQKLGFAPITWLLDIDPNRTAVLGAHKRRLTTP